MSDAQLVLELIDQLLLARSPEFGARLKQRLNDVLVKRGEERFNERLLGFGKFSDFLDSQSHRWKVERGHTNGDISVSLKEAPPAKTTPTPSAVVAGSLLSFRNDVWQAFANPDLKRRRFLDRQDIVVKHFVEGDDQSPIRQLIAEAPQRYSEITPVAGSEQSAWMKEFLRGLPLHEKDRAPIEAMIEGEYTSSINAAFTRALGVYGDAWRRFRTERIASAIDQWASSVDIAAASIRKPLETASLSEHTPQATTIPPLRTKIHKLMELVSDEDLERLILPALLTTISLRASK